MAAPRLAWRIWRTKPAVCLAETPSSRSCPYGRRIGRARSCKGPLVVGQGPATRRLRAEAVELRLASLRATKLIRKGTPVLTCYRNTSSALGTTAQLIKERETLSRMFQCSCYLCGGSCGASGSLVGLGHVAPSSPLDLEVPAPALGPRRLYLASGRCRPFVCQQTNTTSVA